MKKLLTTSLLLALSLGLFSCGNQHEKNIKVGLICIGSQEEIGYTHNFIKGKELADKELKEKGINVTWDIKDNITKGESCESANKKLAENGNQIIINNSYDFEPGMLKVAKTYKDITFIDTSNSGASKDDLTNTHNAFASIYEGRYLSGLVAGLKLNELISTNKITSEEAKIGYIGAFDNLEVKSGYSAYYLGAKSVCPSVKMLVKFVNTWNDSAKEEMATIELINKGAKVISQHSDSAVPSKVSEEKGVYSTGYNSDMIDIAPHSSLISTRIDWSIYFKHVIETIVNNKVLEQDYCKGLDENAIVMTTLNKNIAAKNSEEKLNEAINKIKNNTLHVFDTSTFTVNGEHVTQAFAIDTNNDGIADSKEAIYDGYFHESEYQSSPYFHLNIDGITIVK